MRPQVRLIEGVVMRSDVFGDNFITGNSLTCKPNNNPACPNGQNKQYLANRGEIFNTKVGHFQAFTTLFMTYNSSVTAFMQHYGRSNL